jgi:hypothetical protein
VHGLPRPTRKAPVFLRPITKRVYVVSALLFTIEYIAL